MHYSTSCYLSKMIFHNKLELILDLYSIIDESSIEKEK